MERLQMKSTKTKSRSVAASRGDVLVKSLFATSRPYTAIRQNPSFSSRIVMGMIVRGIMPKEIFPIPMTNIPLTPSFSFSSSVLLWLRLAAPGLCVEQLPTMNENKRHLTQNGADEQSFRKWLHKQLPAYPKIEVSAVGKNVEKTTESAILERAS